MIERETIGQKIEMLNQGVCTPKQAVDLFYEVQTRRDATLQDKVELYNLIEKVLTTINVSQDTESYKILTEMSMYLDQFIDHAKRKIWLEQNGHNPEEYSQENQEEQNQDPMNEEIYCENNISQELGQQQMHIYQGNAE